MKKIRWITWGLLACAALSAAAFLTSLVFTSLTNAAEKKRLSQLQELNHREEEFATLQASYQEWRQVETVLSQFKRERLFADRDFSTFRNGLNALFVRNQLQASGINFLPGRASVDIKKIIINFVLSGTYANLKKFIYDVENHPQLFFLKKAQLNQAGPQVKGSFSLEVYLGL